MSNQDDGPNASPHEKEIGSGSGYHLDDSMDSNHALNKIRTAGSISMSPEMFEKLYLSPETKAAGELRKKFANPTPV